MLTVIPHNMQDGSITAIRIVDENFTENIEISPIPFDIFNQDNTKKAISRYYLKKKTCENLIHQLEMAQKDFEEAKQEFDLLIHTKSEEVKQVVEESPKPIPLQPKPAISEEHITIPEPIIRAELIESEPEPAPKSLEEITTSIIESNELKSLTENNQLSDVTLKALILKGTKPELLDTIHDMVIKQLKEKGIIEPTFFEKLKKKVGRPSKKIEQK